jgi:RNA polymerase sigma factor (sigma-70 family)
MDGHVLTLDEAAWGRLVARYGGLVWAVARAHRLSDADAADVCQATWLRLVEHLDRVRDRGALGGWLATTARRECLRMLRAGGRVVPVADPPDSIDDRAQVDARLLASERDERLWSAFGRLERRDRALLRMLAADPRPSYEEIGCALGMPVGSIGPTRARALERLRREYRVERGAVTRIL